MKLRTKNPVTRNLIERIYKEGIKRNSGFLKSLAMALNRPRKNLSEVNLKKIEKHARANDFVVVPGSVLGIGEITKPVTVAAIRFSESARSKIEKAGGKCLEIENIIEDVPKNIKVLG